ncbi:hypothetical protein MMC30_004768 [Trapelia coarctata]|nr:hypothetical protein [Trapelia coarctata]
MLIHKCSISPSIYVGFSTVYANNACGPVGGVHTNFTLGFAPGELSTLWAPFPAWPVVTTRPFDVNSVTCGDRPVISAPPELLNYDPAWKTCGQDNWQGVDPPYVLVPAPYLNKDPPIATVAAPAQTTPASPGPTPVPAPAQTPTAMFNPRPVLSMADPVKPAPATNTDKPTVPQPGVLAPSQNVDPFKQPVDPGQSPKPALTKPADPVPVESPAPTPVIIATYITTADGAHVQTVPILSLANFPPALDPAKGLSSADLGAIILSAFNNDPSGNPKQPPDSKPTGTPAAPRPSAGADPASPVPISTFRVDPGTHNTLIQPADPVFTAAGQTIKVPNPSEVVLGDGKTLTLSGSTLTINNTPFYLGSAGLVIGSSTIPIPLPATAPLTVTSAAVPTLLALGNGTTLTLGGPTLTIHGTTVYYGSAGLVVGSSTIPVPGGQVSATMTASTVPTSGSLRLSTAATAVGTGPSSVVINPFKGAAASRGRVRWEMVLLGLSGMGVGALVL